MRFSGAVCFEKNLTIEDSSFVPRNEEKSEERTSNEGEGGGS